MSFYAGVVVTTDKSRAERVVKEVFAKSKVTFVVQEFGLESDDEEDGRAPLALYVVHYESSLLSPYNASKDALLDILAGAPWRWEWMDMDQNPAEDHVSWKLSDSWYATVAGYGAGQAPGLEVEVVVNTRAAVMEY